MLAHDENKIKRLFVTNKSQILSSVDRNVRSYENDSNLLKSVIFINTCLSCDRICKKYWHYGRKPIFLVAQPRGR